MSSRDYDTVRKYTGELELYVQFNIVIGDVTVDYLRNSFVKAQNYAAKNKKYIISLITEMIDALDGRTDPAFSSWKYADGRFYGNITGYIYPNITVCVEGKYIPATYWDPPEYPETSTENWVDLDCVAQELRSCLKYGGLKQFEITYIEKSGLNEEAFIDRVLEDVANSEPDPVDYFKDAFY